jgi:hypothetical protein
MKNERTIITAAPGTRLVYVFEFKACVLENVIAFIADGELTELECGGLYALTVQGAWPINTPCSIDDHGDSNGAYGVLFPNGAIDTELSTYKNIAELQRYLDKNHGRHLKKQETSHD